MKKRIVESFLVILLMASMSVVARNHDFVVDAEPISVQTDVSHQTKKVERKDEFESDILEILAIEPPVVKKVSYKKGYTTTAVNVRKGPSTDDDILDTFPINHKVKYANYNDSWYQIKYKDSFAYISKKYISKNKTQYTEYSVPKNRGYKSYMPYTAITSRGSAQYKLQISSAYTGTYGIRQVNGRYCVAIGSHFTSEIGVYFDLVLENGTIIPCILADQKADIHTDAQNIVTVSNGCLTEFIVDSQALDSNAKRIGDISYCNNNWKSPVCKIRVYN